MSIRDIVIGVAIGFMFGLLFLGLVGCTAAPPKPAPSPPTVPEEARSCPPAEQVPLPPPAPRTVEAVATWGKRASLSATKNASALQICDDRRKAVVDLVDGLTVP